MVICLFELYLIPYTHNTGFENSRTKEKGSRPKAQSWTNLTQNKRFLNDISEPESRVFYSIYLFKLGRTSHHFPLRNSTMTEQRSLTMKCGDTSV
jgi:hypothetical protein